MHHLVYCTVKKHLPTTTILESDPLLVDDPPLDVSPLQPSVEQ